MDGVEVGAPIGIVPLKRSRIALTPPVGDRGSSPCSSSCVAAGSLVLVPVDCPVRVVCTGAHVFPE